MLEKVNTAGELSDSWGTWISGLAEWDWFITLSFRDPAHQPGKSWTKPGWGRAKQAWTRFMDFVIGDPALGKWVRCLELQKWRGTPHVHGLVSGVDPALSIKNARDWAYHHYGIARIDRYNPNLGAAWYITKYVNSDAFDIDFGGDFPAGAGEK